ncbi:ribonuclease P protein subunit [Nanoarchaeota archaeon]
MAKTSVYKGELIGKTIKITDSKNPSEIGIEGKITDETKNLLIMENKKFFKKNITIKLNNQIIEGKKLLKRPEERIK